MNKLSEEEIIQRFKILINNFEDDKNYYLYDISQKILDLYKQEKEKNKELEEKLKIANQLYNDSCICIATECVEKDKITSILGLENNTTIETVLQYIATLVSENARLEDIEDRKVQIEYELVFNKGVKSVEDKIKAKIEELAEIENKMKEEYSDYPLREEYQRASIGQIYLQKLLEE